MNIKEVLGWNKFMFLWWIWILEGFDELIWVLLTRWNYLKDDSLWDVFKK